MGQADAWLWGVTLGDQPVGQGKMTDAAIRDAATLILLRRGGAGLSVLMGQRGAGAAFMPGKFVFPGGAVDEGDALAPLALPLDATCVTRLGAQSRADPAALAAAAIRELWEEAGLRLGLSAPWPDPPADWQGFARGGHRPAGNALSFIFRAITPPGNPRRFDARFFLAEATALIGDPDDFSAASDELNHLQWVPLDHLRGFDLPFITEIVLAEVAALAGREGPPPSVPFFDNSGPEPRFHRL